ncbi:MULTISPECIES: acetamidase/formamidase family protein [unclassified Arthrobacter]|uniref:acetamidase/formamidase family protein n=1 Tax=unclassified Arthrobacter TaxID=235627 RepID=UPI002E00F322|nr:MULTISPECIES: acetamidase/formamidase family protein [unclassified Arthrobacter]MEC5192374.1 acetamidase/formamidase [Arthrobacter sp. MP_M4]MEC5203859.1 acetamidase/formamidase [Arthrobacter sp. MP_M7]
MAIHELHAAPETTADAYSRAHSPVLVVDPGDTIVVDSLDASGYLSRQTTPGEQQPRMFAERRGHCLTGPIAIRGAMPGDMLALHLINLRPGDWGWTVAGARDSPITKRLNIGADAPSWLLWDLDSELGTATESRGFRRSLAPFLGVMGLAPAEEGEHSTTPPRAANAGNIDCRELVEGSTLYIPVAVPDALLYLGDGHAAQGDGEVGGTAIECPMRTEAKVEIALDRPLATLHAETPGGRITFGFNEDLNLAMGDALDAMVIWMTRIYSVDKPTALALAGTVVDLRITQVANQVWGVHAVLPNGALA